MRTFTAIAALMLFASPVLADDTSDPTRGFRGTNLDNGAGVGGGAIYPAPFASATHSTAHVSTVPAAELKAAQEANTAHRRRVYDDLVAAGGCNADFLPVEYAIPCSYNSFGKQTEGGGDGSNTGGE